MEFLKSAELHKEVQSDELHGGDGTYSPAILEALEEIERLLTEVHDTEAGIAAIKPLLQCHYDVFPRLRLEVGILWTKGYGDEIGMGTQSAKALFDGLAMDLDSLGYNGELRLADSCSLAGMFNEAKGVFEGLIGRLEFMVAEADRVGDGAEIVANTKMYNHVVVAFAHLKSELLLLDNASALTDASKFSAYIDLTDIMGTVRKAVMMARFNELGLFSGGSPDHPTAVAGVSVALEFIAKLADAYNLQNDSVDQRESDGPVIPVGGFDFTRFAIPENMPTLLNTLYTQAQTNSMKYPVLLYNSLWKKAIGGDVWVDEDELKVRQDYTVKDQIERWTGVLNGKDDRNTRGGWNKKRGADDGRVFSTKCDFDRRKLSDLSKEEFWNEYVRKGRPVIIDGMLDESGGVEKFRPEYMLQPKVGKESLTLVDPIDVVTFHSLRHASRGKLKNVKVSSWVGDLLRGHSETRGLFDGGNTDGKYSIEAHTEFSQHMIVEGLGAEGISDYFKNDELFPVIQFLRDTNGLFYLGGDKTSTYLHRHTAAYNTLYYGTKEWFLLPPGSALPGDRGLTEFDALEGEVVGTDKEGELWNNIRPWKAMTCVQNEGEVFFIPRQWSHAVRNLEVVVGAGVEIG